jgi:DNA-directed RNA polymerase sigma subunit (sigma70/sigma32)
MHEKRNRPPQADMTQQEVADAFGVSRAAIADIEKRALRKLRNELRRRGLTVKEFLDWFRN